MSTNGERERGSREEECGGSLYPSWVSLAMGAHMAMCSQRFALGRRHMCVNGPVHAVIAMVT